MKNRFSRWRPWLPSWNADRNDFSYFDLQVTPMLPTKFRVNWHLGLGEKAKNRFSRFNDLPSFDSTGLSVQEKKQKIDFQNGGIGCHLGFPIGIILAIFDLQVTLMLPTKFRVNRFLGLREEAKIDFQDGGHLGFPIGTILATFDLQVIPMLPTKFRVNCPFGSEEEAKNRFSRWLPWRPSWISDWHDF